MARKFENQVVWITGGGTGLGKALALEFASQGAKLGLAGRRKENLDTLVSQIQSQGGQALAVLCDVVDDQSVESAVAQVVNHFGKLDVAIANAGFGVSGPIEKLTVEDWKRQYDTNVFGLISTIRHSLPELKKTKGRMVLIGSIMGSISLPGSGPYQSSKYAVRSISQTLSMELHGTGVTCTHIQPGLVESEIGQVDNQGKFRENWEDRRPSRFMWKADKAARVMVRGIYKRKREFAFTGHGKLALFLGRHLPGLVHFAVTRFGIKNTDKEQRQKN